ncbi:hypothetical protein [Streptomyces xanthophaeus]
MAPTRRIPGRVLRLSLGAGMVCGLVAGPAPPAQAGGRFEPPTLLSLKLDAPTAYVTLRDNVGPGTGGTDIGVLITLTQKDAPTPTSVRASSAGVPERGRVVTRTVTGIKPDATYCAVAQSHVRRDVDNVTDLNDQVAGLLNGHTSYSNQVCAGPGGSADESGSATADVAVRAVTGDATGPVGGTRNYWVQYANESQTPARGLVIEAQTSGALGVRNPPASGTFNGFTCTAVAAGGAATGGFRCTGGSLKAGEKGQIPVLAKVTTAGTGTVHVSISAEGDPVPGNNGQTFTMQGQ